MASRFQEPLSKSGSYSPHRSHGSRTPFSNLCGVIRVEIPGLLYLNDSSISLNTIHRNSGPVRSVAGFNPPRLLDTEVTSFTPAHMGPCAWNHFFELGYKRPCY
jgi:hypothetical protein